MPARWNDLLVAYLHDPPDKALDIRAHVERARRYIAVALDDVAEGRPGGEADQQAARAERLPAPHWQYLKVDPNGTLQTFHPLSGQPHPLDVGSCDPDWVTRHIQHLVTQAGQETERRFLVLWRLLPERLAADGHPEYAYLPADTRIPDHTIWHHLDITAGLEAAQVDTVTGRAFLSFSLGPVQGFISAARTVRDLWSGSMILSYLAFQAMMPIVREYGPTAMVYPALRGVPLLDLWLRQKRGFAGKLLPDPDVALKRAPCLPNRFLAVVPWGPDGAVASKLARECRDSAWGAWKRIATHVRDRLGPHLSALVGDWDPGQRWDKQISSFFEFRTAVLPWSAFQGSSDKVASLWKLWGPNNRTFQDAFPDPGRVRALHDASPDDEKPGSRRQDGRWQPYEATPVGDWQAKVELSARLMEAQRSVRHFPDYEPGLGDVPPKCSMFGTYEQMGPANLEDSARFWEAAGRVHIEGVRLRDRERLCAVALVKRFSGPCFLRKELELRQRDLRYDDTATVAAAEWLDRAQIDPDRFREQPGGWSGQWLHWSRRDVDKDDECPEPIWNQIDAAKRRMWEETRESPPIYYAVLMMDGDNLGGWLRGENSPPVRTILHPALRAYFERLPGSEPGLDARRPVSPALHAALSSALANFALHVVPDTVERKYHGRLIYSGGDDTLALLPAREALGCARALQLAYQSDYYPDDRAGWLMMGRKSTLSAGLAVVHYKEDLRTALDAAREAEKQAKNAGRDVLVITTCRRSGERASAVCPWPFVDRVARWTEGFRGKASDRWAYHLRGELATLRGLSVGAMEAEIRRQVSRAEEATKKVFKPDDVAADFQSFRQTRKRVQEQEQPRFADAATALSHFLTLIQTASFLARGRET